MKLENNQRIAQNTAILYFRMIFITIVSLYTSRCVLTILGVSDYGVYSIVGGVVVFFGVFNSTITSATQRFLSFDIGRKDQIQLQKTFNALMFIHIGIALLMFITAESIGLWFIDNHLNLPEGRMEASRWVFHFSVLSFIVSIIQSPYNALIIAHERMAIFAYFSIVETLLKLFIVILLTQIDFDKLKLYGVLVFVASLIVGSIYLTYSKNHFKETKFLLVRDKSLFTKLVSYSAWNLFGAISGILKIQGVNIMLNIFYGTLVNAALGIANQVSGIVTSFVSNFQTASRPQIIKSYSRNDIEYVNSLVVCTSKLSFFLLFVIILPILLEIDFILRVWLNIVPEYTAIFTTLILIHALIESVSGPLMTAVTATGTIRAYQIVVGFLTMSILPLTWLIFNLGYPPQSTFIVSISVAIVALIFRILFTKKLIPEFSVRRFSKQVLVRAGCVAFISSMLPLLLIVKMEPGWLRITMVLLVSPSISLLTIYYIGLLGSEKIFVQTFLARGRRRIS